MSSLVGSEDYDFAIYASHATHDSYSIVIYPPVSKALLSVTVAAAKFKDFLTKQKGKIEGANTSPTEDVFIHSLSLAEVSQLTSL